MTARTSMPRWALPVFLGAISLFLRLSVLSKGPFNVDGLILALNSEHFVNTMQLRPMFGTGYPLTVLLGALFVWVTRLGGNTDPVFAVNLMSAVVSALTVTVFFLFVEEFLNRNAAVFSAGMLCVLPVFLGLSTYGKSHTPSLFFLVLGLLMLERFLRSGKEPRLLAAGCFFGCMAACRLQELALMVLPLSVRLLTAPAGPARRGAPPGPKRLKDLALLWSAAAGSALLFHLPLLFTGGNEYVTQLHRYWTASSVPNFMGFISPSLGETLRVIVFELTPVGTALALAGLALLFHKDRARAVFLLLWLTLPLMVLGNLGMTTPRFYLICFLPLLVGQGYFCAVLFRVPRPEFRRGVFCVYALVVILLLVNILPILAFRHEYTLLPDFARFVRDKTAPSARVITGDEAMFIRYYGHREIFSRPNDPLRITPADLQRFKARLDAALSGGEPVYITSSGLYSYDPDLAFSRFLKNNYRLDYIGERLSEDWHQGATRLRLGVEKLYRIRRP